MTVTSADETILLRVEVFPLEDLDPRIALSEYRMNEGDGQMQALVLEDAVMSFACPVPGGEPSTEFKAGSTINLVRDDEGWFLSNTGWESREGMLPVDVSF